MLIPALIHMLEDVRLTDAGYTCHCCHHYKDDIPTPADRLCSTRVESWYFSRNHGDSHQKTNNFLSVPSHFRLLHVRTCRCHGSRAGVACEQLRQPSGVSHTHNRKMLVLLLNRFSLLPSWFREGWGDVQTQHTVTEALWKWISLFKKKKKKITKFVRVWYAIVMTRFFLKLLTKLNSK